MAVALKNPTMALGHVVVPSCIPTAISLSYRDLTHAVSLTHGVSLTQGVSLTHAVSFTHAISLKLCTRLSTHFATLINTHTGTFTLGICATTSAPGVFIPPKIHVYPFAALAPSNSQRSTGPTWSRSASRENSVTDFNETWWGG